LACSTTDHADPAVLRLGGASEIQLLNLAGWLFPALGTGLAVECEKAGVMLDGQGLTPTSKAKRVNFKGSKRTVFRTT
jgi:hypothetical protein